MNYRRIVALALSIGLLSFPVVSAAGRLTADVVVLTLEWSEVGVQQSDLYGYGYAVSTAGDVDGDGYDDVIVGAPIHQLTVNTEGAAFVFTGTAGGLGNTPAWSAGGGESGARFGAAVGSAGDVDGDGYDDVIVGAFAYGKPAVGRVVVFYGSPGGLSDTPDWSMDGEQVDAQWGVAVGTAGDVDGDGYDEVIIGANQYDQDHEQEGRVYLLSGSPGGLTTTTALSWTYSGAQAGALLGSAVGWAGDVNGDGYDDVVVGAPGYDRETADEGAVYLFTGSPDGLGSTPAWTVYGGQAGAGFGSAVGSAGDVNDDGYDDVVVGAPDYDGAQTGSGGAFLFYGSAAGLAATAGWTFFGDQEYGRLGATVGAAGDVNGNGYDDVVVGAPEMTMNYSHEGVVLLFCGAAGGLSSAPCWSAGGGKADTGFGFSVGTAGDVNGDAAADVVVGAPQYRFDRDIVGQARLYQGKRIVLQPVCFLPLVVRDNLP